MPEQGPNLVIERTKNQIEIGKGPDPKKVADPTRAQKDPDQGQETEKGPGLVTGTAKKVVNQDPDHVIITEVVEDLEVDLNQGTEKGPDLGIETEKLVNVVDLDLETDIQDPKDLDHVKRDLGHVIKDLDHVTENKVEGNEESLLNPPRLHPDLNFALRKTRIIFMLS